MKEETRRKRSRINELREDIADIKAIIAHHQEEIDKLQEMVAEKEAELAEKLGYQTLIELEIEF